MAQIILRQANAITSTGATVKGSPLTNAEVDNNFANLNVASNQLESNVGYLVDLTTNDRTSIVSSINEYSSDYDKSCICWSATICYSSKFNIEHDDSYNRIR